MIPQVWHQRWSRLIPSLIHSFGRVVGGGLVGCIMLGLGHDLVAIDYFSWNNKESSMSPNGVTINQGNLQPSSNSGFRVTINALAFDPQSNQLRLNWIDGSAFDKTSRVLVVNGPLYLLKNGLIPFPQQGGTARKDRNWNLQNGNLQVFFSLDWYYRQAGNSNQYDITPTWPTTPSLSTNQTNVSTLVQQFDSGPMITLPMVAEPVPLYGNNSASIQLKSVSSVTRYLPYGLPTTPPADPDGIPNTIRPYRNGNDLHVRLLTGGVAYVIKNVAYQVASTKNEYTVMYGPYRLSARNSQSPLSDIPVLQQLTPSSNQKPGIRFDLSEWFFAPLSTNPDQLVQVARPAIGLPYAVMIGGLFNTLSGGVLVKGSGLVTGVLGGQFNNDPNRTVIDWSTGTFQQIKMTASGRSLTFVDPTYNGTALPPTTLYLLVERTGNGVLTFAQPTLRWPDADANTDTHATRSDEFELSSDLVDWSQVTEPLFQVYTFIYTGTHYLGAYSGLYNTKAQGNGRRF